MLILPPPPLPVKDIPYCLRNVFILLFKSQIFPKTYSFSVVLRTTPRKDTLKFVLNILFCIESPKNFGFRQFFSTAFYLLEGFCFFFKTIYRWTAREEKLTRDFRACSLWIPTLNCWRWWIIEKRFCYPNFYWVSKQFQLRTF